MSTSNAHNATVGREKFTRGEKCIFIHLVLTFALILTVVLIYLVHLYAVEHTVYDVFKTRRSFESSTARGLYVRAIVSMRRHPAHNKISECFRGVPLGANTLQLCDTTVMSEDLWEFYLTRDIQIGMAYIKLESPVALCNTIQFSTSWSIAPGFCVAMRSEPDMKNVVLLWRIKYAIGNDGKDLEIIRTIVHPLFTRTSLAHNIGLFQHETWDTQEFISIMLPFSINARGDKNMIIGSRTNFEGQTEINYHRIKIMQSTHCNEIMSFIENIRKYEFCATFLERHDTVIGRIIEQHILFRVLFLDVELRDIQEHGALVTEDNKITGIFSWGDKNGKALPFVILNISYYQTWIRQEQRSYSNLEINENLL